MKKITTKLNGKFSSLAQSLGVSIIGNTFFFFIQCFFSEGKEKY